MLLDSLCTLFTFFSLLASFVCIFLDPDSTKLLCIQGPFGLSVYLMAYSAFIFWINDVIFLFSHFHNSQERMHVVHLIFKVAVHGQCYLAVTHLAGVWVRHTAEQIMENKSGFNHCLETSCTSLGPWGGAVRHSSHQVSLLQVTFQFPT